MPIVQTILDRIIAFAQAEPVRVATWIAAAVVAVASHYGLVVDKQSVVNDLVLLLPIVLGGEVARRKVTPHKAQGE